MFGDLKQTHCLVVHVAPKQEWPRFPLRNFLTNQHLAIYKRCLADL